MSFSLLPILSLDSILLFAVTEEIACNSLSWLLLTDAAFGQYILNMITYVVCRPSLIYFCRYILCTRITLIFFYLGSLNQSSPFPIVCVCEKVILNCELWASDSVMNVCHGVSQNIKTSIDTNNFPEVDFRPQILHMYVVCNVYVTVM